MIYRHTLSQKFIIFNYTPGVNYAVKNIGNFVHKFSPAYPKNMPMNMKKKKEELKKKRIKIIL